VVAGMCDQNIVMAAIGSPFAILMYNACVHLYSSVQLNSLLTGV